MSAEPPPTPDGEHLTVGYVSSNGDTPNIWSERAYRLVVLAYITAVAMPPIGLVLGIVVARGPTKQTSKHWRWIILVAIIASIVWVLVFASGALESNNNDFG